MKHPLADFMARLDGRRGDLLSILSDACPRGRALDGEAAGNDLVAVTLGFVSPSSQRPDPRAVARDNAVAAAAPQVRTAAAAAATTLSTADLLTELGKLAGHVEALDALPASAFKGSRGRAPISSSWLFHVGLLAAIYRRHTGRKPANASFSPSEDCRYINGGFPALLRAIIEVSQGETCNPDQIYNLVRKAREIHPEQFV